MSKSIHSKLKLIFAITMIISLLILNSCRNEEIYRLMKIRTDEVVNVTDTSAVAFGVIIDLGEGISEYGFCWNSTGAPTVADNKLDFANASQTGKFTGVITGLSGGATYYVNTYATKGNETIYGEEKVFTCIEGLPKISTGDITNIDKASATGAGNITDDGGSTVLTKGFVWSKTENPVLGRLDGLTDVPGDDTDFTTQLTNLVPNETFYVRAYATNGNGTGYGEVKQITTLAPESGDLIWANYYGSFNHEEVNEICTDNNGNIFVTGRFLEYSTLGDYTLNSVGGYDIFVAKLSDEGEVLWTTSAGGVGDDNCYGISVDNSGNIYLTGTFENTITFGTKTLNSAGAKDYFVVKYNSSGGVEWAQRAGGTNNDEGSAVISDTNGDIYTTGSTLSTSITFGAYTLSTYRVFTVKYNSAGTVQWAREIDQSNSYAIRTDNSSNVFIAGNKEVGALPGGAIFSTIFVAKYSNTGTFQWSNVPVGQTLDNKPTGLVCDASGNVYVTGHSGNITFAGQPELTAFGYDVFIAKYNTSGLVQWAKSIDGLNNDFSGGITVDANDNLYIIGTYLSNDLVIDTYTLENISYKDIFQAKYNSNGDALSAKSYTGAVDDYGIAVCSFNPNYIYIAGYANSRFLTLDYFTIESMGRNDLIIAKIQQ